MPWGMVSVRTQRFHIRKAKQVVNAALAEVAPQDAEKLWIFLVQSKVAAQQTNEEATDFKLADAPAECFKNAGHWGSRRHIYYGRQNGFRKLAKLTSWSYSVQV